MKLIVILTAFALLTLAISVILLTILPNWPLIRNALLLGDDQQ